MRSAEEERTATVTAVAAPTTTQTRADARVLALVAKRLIDLCVAGLGLLVLSPVLVLIGVAIKLESRGPALFKQERLGKNAAPFMFYKFRTMAHDNDPEIHQRYVRELITSCSDELKGDTGSFKIENDPRVTRIGRFLRRWSIDEVPQLINVVLGEMSLVGPRPPVRYEYELYTPKARRRLEVLPGMTGLWQVSGRCQTTFDEMIDLDVAYVDNWSLGLDLSILARTVPVVFGRKGAW